MSRLRNRNIRAKIHAVARWAGSPTNTTTTADSGIGEALPHAKTSDSRGRSRRGERATAERRVGGPTNVSGDSSDDESRRSFSSVDTLRVLEEIRNLEDSAMSASADSYNSWNEEYEHDNTQLVKAEFERMERVLQRREAIPPHYDKDEYRLWIKTFPLLSLVTCAGGRRSSSNFAADIVVDELETFREPTATHSDKCLAINSTLNPRTVSIAPDHSFLQLAPLNLARRQSLKPARARGSGAHWWTDDRFATFCSGAQAEKRSSTQHRHQQPERRRKSSQADSSLKSSSEFIVLPPIDGRELRSSSAATIANVGKASVLSLARLKHPPVGPLYEHNEHCDESDGFVSYRHRKRKY